MKDKIQEVEKTIQDQVRALSESIYKNPEIAHTEVFASKAHMDLLRAHGFFIEDKYLGLKTAFKARFDSKKPGPSICYMAEYDALPGIGHGCGHNILGAASTGAAILVSKFIDQTGGQVVLLGTPAEESDGAKVTMADAGIFKDYDLALMAHPDCHYRLSGTSLALKALAYEFFGKPAHAGSSPHEGINALDALVLFYNGVGLLRQQVKTTARIHGIIREGGKAANIIPDYARGDFYIRAQTKDYLLDLEEKLDHIAQGAALATGCSYKSFPYEFPNDNLVTNQTLNQVFEEGIRTFTRDPILPGENSMGSLDAGNVSHDLPTIHGYFPISQKEIPAHTKEFAQATLTDYALEILDEIICILAYTGLKVLGDRDLVGKIKAEYQDQLARGLVIPHGLHKEEDHDLS